MRKRGTEELFAYDHTTSMELGIKPQEVWLQSQQSQTLSSRGNIRINYFMKAVGGGNPELMVVEVSST